MKYLTPELTQGLFCVSSHLVIVDEVLISRFRLDNALCLPWRGDYWDS